MNSIKTIFWISTIYNKDNRQSYISAKILDYLKVEAEVILFTPERLAEKVSIELNDINIVSIQRLPEFCRIISDYTIVYNLEDSASCNLITYFINQYPGIILLHDLSLFNLEISRLSHGTVETEINSLIQERYGSQAALVGTQYVLNKSIEVYQYLYDFLGQVSETECSVFVFSREVQSYLTKRGYQTSVINLPTLENQFPIKQYEKTDFNILFHLRSKLSKIGLDLSKLIGDNFNQRYCVLRVHNVESKLRLEITPYKSVNSIEEFLLNNKINFVVEVGNSPLIGIGPFTLASLEFGIPVMLEESFETRVLKFNLNSLYEKSESLSRIIDRLITRDEDLHSVRRIDYPNLAKNLIGILIENLSSMQSHRAQKSKLKTQALNKAKILILNSVKTNSDFDIIFPNCYFKAVNESLSNLLKLNE